RGNRPHMRFAREFARVEVPDPGERRIVEFEPAIEPEDSDTFLQRIERGGLHLHKGVVGALERELLGYVLVEIGESAEGMRLDNDAKCLTGGYVPEFLRRMCGRPFIESKALALPL